MGEVVDGISLFRAEAIQISYAFPSLSFLEQDGKSIVAGEFELKDTEGVSHENYFIEIHPVAEYPYRFPLVFETGGRIPRNIDWHIFESDGHCCLKTQPEEILLCKAGINLQGFIEKEVKPYFFNQLFREKHGYFLQERSHGLLGELEYFFDLFKTKDLLRLYELMSYVAKRIEPGRTENCFCGSKEKYRRCHRETYRTVIKFTDEELRYFVQQIIESKALRYLYPLQDVQLLKEC